MVLSFLTLSKVEFAWLVYVLIWAFQRNRTNRIFIHIYKSIYIDRLSFIYLLKDFKGLAHMIMETDKSKISKAFP